MRLHLNASSAQLLRSTAIRTLRFFSSVAIHTRCFSRYPGDGFSSRDRERRQCQFEHATVPHIHTRAVSHARSLGCWRYVNNTRWPSSRAGSRLQSRSLGGAIFRHELTSTSTPNVAASVLPGRACNPLADCLMALACPCVCVCVCVCGHSSMCVAMSCIIGRGWS